MRAYILIRCDAGEDSNVADDINQVQVDGARILHCNAVTGPYDVIAEVEAENLEILGHILSEHMQNVRGVQHTITCLAVHLQ